ncbi:hypothetical protein O6H91_09G063200 [Diphasiastrum complanatum]|uniref:Uncharacterized protein n=1 Tax=Diphasiastrum complanatum TaxID=34168 RepID=A0ACC2CQ68_DIPCM|nr:hypothetical protein O6H91_09G063200 [Diphasiastrum complanatum]
MAASKKSSRSGLLSGSFSDEDKFRVGSVQNHLNSPWKKNRLADIQEHCNGHNSGASNRKLEPYSEDEGSGSSQSSISEYLRPKIHKDLLPHDFMKWTSSGYLAVSNGADDHFYTKEKWREGIGPGAIQENREGLENSCLSDWIQQFKGWERGTGQKPSFLKEMEMHGGISTVGNIDKDLYQNLVEMIPLMESFMDQRGNQRRSFSHHASLVYTPAPPRDGPARKESPLKTNKNKQQKSSKPGEVKGDGPRWEEQENVLTKVETENGHESNDQSYHNQSANQHTLQLQNQIEELKQKLSEKDQLLQAVRTYDDAHDAVTKTNEQLQNKIEELQQELTKKEYLAHSVQLRLSEQQHEIEGMSTLLGRLQGDVLRKNDKTFRMEEELDGLRCQVTALRYQLEAVDLNGADLDNANAQGIELDQDEQHQMSVSSTGKSCEEFTNMESARRMYLAAVVAAREKPGEEALTLAAELRMQLQTFLMQPPLLSKRGDALTSQTLGFPLF